MITSCAIAEDVTRWRSYVVEMVIVPFIFYTLKIVGLLYKPPFPPDAERNMDE